MRDTNHTHKEKLVSVVSGVCVSWGGILLLEFSIPSSPIPLLPPPSFPPSFLPLPSLPPSQNVLGSWHELFTVYAAEIASHLMEAHTLVKKKGVCTCTGGRERWRDGGGGGRKGRKIEEGEAHVFVGDIPPTDVAIFLLCSCQGSTESANLLHKHNQVI